MRQTTDATVIVGEGFIPSRQPKLNDFLEGNKGPLPNVLKMQAVSPALLLVIEGQFIVSHADGNLTAFG